MFARSHVTDNERRVPEVSAAENQFWLHPCGLNNAAPLPLGANVVE
jgi:hypothetical protein